MHLRGERIAALTAKEESIVARRVGEVLARSSKRPWWPRCGSKWRSQISLCHQIVVVFAGQEACSLPIYSNENAREGLIKIYLEFLHPRPAASPGHDYFRIDQPTEGIEGRSWHAVGELVSAASSSPSAISYWHNHTVQNLTSPNPIAGLPSRGTMRRCASLNSR